MEQVTNLPVVSAHSNVFDKMHYEPVCLPDYATIEDYFNAIGWPEYSKPFTMVFLNGLKYENWNYIVQPGDSVQFIVVPGGGGDGGKATAALIASIAITIFSVGVGSGLIFGLKGGAAAMAAAGIGVVGNLLIGAVFKPPIASNNTIDGASTATDPFGPSPIITGQSNQGRIGGVIPKIYGHHRIFPDLASQPYVEKFACKQVLHALYCTGYGAMTIDLDSIEFGGVADQDLPGLSPFSQNFKGALSDKMIDRYKGRNESIPVSHSFDLMEDELTEAYIEQISTIVQVAENSTSVYFDFVFPSGLFNTDSGGNVVPHRASVSIQKEGANDWTEVVTDDLDGYGVTSCSRTDDGSAPYIEGSVENQDFTEKWWGDIRGIVSGAGTGSGDGNLVPSNTVMCDSSGDAISTSSGLWNSGEGLNDSDDNGKNVTITQQTDPFDSSKYVNWAEATEVDPFNIHYLMYPNNGGSFAAGHYSVVMVVGKPQYIDPLAGEGNDDWRDTGGCYGWFYAKSQDNSFGVAPGNRGFTDLDTSSFSFVFTLDEDTDMGEHLRIGLSPDNTLVYLDKYRIRFQFVSLTITFTPPEEELEEGETLPVVETVIEIGVKNTDSSDPDKRQPVPTSGSNFYPASKVDCGTPGEDFNDPAKWGKCLKKDGPAYTVKGNPVRIGTTTDGDRSIYHLTLSSQLQETQSDYYIFETVYPAGFHVSGTTRNPLHFGIQLKCQSGNRFRVFKSSPTPATASDALVLNALNCSNATMQPVTMPANSGNLAYGLVALQAEASNLIGSQLKPLSLEVYGYVRSFDVGKYSADPDEPVSTSADYDDTRALNQNTISVDTVGSPAWSFINILMGNAADRPIGILGKQFMGDFFDLPAFSRWAKYCKDNGYYFNLVVDNISTVGELLQMIAATGKAVPIRPDGKYSILFDGDPAHFTEVNGVKVPIATQLVTPQNSWGLEASISYVKKTHALKMKYLPALSDKENIIICYDEGFSENGPGDYYTENSSPPWKATKFETINLPGVTDHLHAESLGHYYLAQNRLRRERLSLSMDMENLISIEGDVMAVAHDVLKMGGITVYVVSSERVNDKIHVSVSLPIPQPAQDQSIGIRFRYFEEGTARDGYGEPKLTDVYDAAAYPAEPTTIIYDRLNADGSTRPYPQDGTMLIWGEKETITQDYQITNIKYSNDLSARLDLLEYVPDVENATGRSTIGETPTEGYVNPPTNVTINILWSFNGSEWIMTYEVDWDDMDGISGMGGVYRVNFGGAVTGNQIVTDVSYYKGNPQTMIAGVDSMTVCVTSIDLYGNESEPPDPYIEGVGCATTAIECPGGIPASITNFSSNSTSGDILLSWSPPKVIDPLGCILKVMTETEYLAFPVDTDGVPIVTYDDGDFPQEVPSGLIPWVTTSINLKSNVTEEGLVYLIWVYSACGKYSEAPAVTVLDYAVSEGYVPDPYEYLWAYGGTGIHVNTEDDGTILQLAKDSNGLFYEEGWFLPAYFEDYAGDTGTVQLTTFSRFTEAYFEFLLEEMVPLSIAQPLSGKNPADETARYVEVYRWSDPDLSETGSLTELLWAKNDSRRSIISGVDVTAKRIYYGLRLVTDLRNITPRVEVSGVERKYIGRGIDDDDAKMNVYAGQPESITQVTFYPRWCNFLPDPVVKPKITVTTESVDGSIVWDIINVTNTGFQVRVKNAPFDDIDATFDWTAYGYGKFCPD